jgi:hypothetical protein
MTKIRRLRCYWASFALLITLGLISELVFIPYSSPWQLCQAHPRRLHLLCRPRGAFCATGSGDLPQPQATMGASYRRQSKAVPPAEILCFF